MCVHTPGCVGVQSTPNRLDSAGPVSASRAETAAIPRCLLAPRPCILYLHRRFVNYPRYRFMNYHRCRFVKTGCDVFFDVSDTGLTLRYFKRMHIFSIPSYSPVLPSMFVMLLVRKSTASFRYSTRFPVSRVRFSKSKSTVLINFIAMSILIKIRDEFSYTRTQRESSNRLK